MFITVSNNDAMSVALSIILSLAFFLFIIAWPRIAKGWFGNVMSERAADVTQGILTTLFVIVLFIAAGSWLAAALSRI